MEVATDMIDQVSYECGESSGYIDGSKDGYEYGYHDCILDLVKKRNNYTRTRRRKIRKLLYFTKQKLWGVALLLLTFFSSCLVWWRYDSRSSHSSNELNTYMFKEEVVAMSIRSWLIFCVFVLIMGVVDLTLCIIDREERRKEDKKND